MRAAMFSVGNPHKPKNADHFVYTVFVSNECFISFRVMMMKDNLRCSEGTKSLISSVKSFPKDSQDSIFLLSLLSLPRYSIRFSLKLQTKNENEKAWERAHLLNLFLKQIVRCPYLFESEEFHLFIRPHIALDKALTLLPKLTFEENLARINKYFSLSGEISETQL